MNNKSTSRNISYFYLWVFMLICLGFLFLAHSLANDTDVIEEAAEIPAVLGEAQYQKFLAQKKELDNERMQLESDIGTFNSNCSSVSSKDKAKLASCQAGYQELQQRISNYNNALNAYDAAIEEAKVRTLIQILPPDRTTPVYAGKPPAKPQVVTPLAPSANAELKEQRAKLEKEYWDLEEQIAKEKNPVKRAELINRQTSLKSQLAVLELEILDYYKYGEEITAWKEKRVKGLLDLAALEMTYRQLHHEECLGFLQSALKEAPGDKGIERAINYVNYLKELGPGFEFDPKFSVLVDALTYGDWNATFAYLERAAKDNPDDLVIRDALNVLDGISTHSAYNWEAIQKREAEEAHKAIAEGLDAVLQNDFESAYKLFKQARKLAPDDVGVRDAMYFADGVIFKSPRGKSGEWQREKGFEWEIYTNELFPETQRSDEVHKLYLKALEKIPSGNYEGALKFLKQLYKRNTADQEIRDKINWLEGICSQRYSVTRQKK